jgi:hypothetical protein
MLPTTLKMKRVKALVHHWRDYEALCDGHYNAKWHVPVGHPYSGKSW